MNHTGTLFQQWLNLRGLNTNTEAAKYLNMSIQVVGHHLNTPNSSIKTLNTLAEKLGIEWEICWKPKETTLTADEENAGLEEVLGRKDLNETCSINCDQGDWHFGGKCDLNGCYVPDRPIPRTPTPDEIEAARKEWEAEKSNGVHEAEVQEP